MAKVEFKDFITIRLDVAKLIVGGCLPRNERNMRGADPLLVVAITEFKTTVLAASAAAKK